MSRTLEQAVREQVQSHRLDDRQAATLRAMQEQAGSGHSRAGWGRWGGAVLAAACALALLVYFLVPAGTGLPQPARIADEVDRKSVV